MKTTVNWVVFGYPSLDRPGNSPLETEAQTSSAPSKDPRTAVSLNEEVCREAFLKGRDIEIPVAPEWRNLGQFYSMALKGAMFHACLPCQPYEWNSSLNLVATDPELERLWLSGEDVFSRAPIAQGGLPFTHPFWQKLYQHAFHV